MSIRDHRTGRRAQRTTTRQKQRRTRSRSSHRALRDEQRAAEADVSALYVQERRAG